MEVKMQEEKRIRKTEFSGNEWTDKVFLKPFLTLLFLLFLTTTACKDDPPASTSTSNSQTFGLKIDGEWTDEQGVSHPIDTLELRKDLMSACYELSVNMEKSGGQAGNPTGAPSGGYSILEEACADSEYNYCQRWYCSMQLALCVGHFMMTIADTVYILEFDVNRYLGDFLSEYSFHGAEPSGTKVHYKIPPQNNKNKTLAYREAMEAFRNSAIYGSQILIDDSSYGNCIPNMIFKEDNNLPEKAVYNDKGEMVYLKDIFSVTYGEAVRSFTEALKKVTENTVAVADSQLSQERNSSRAIENQWNGTMEMGFDNSRRSSALTLYGTPLLQRNGSDLGSDVLKSYLITPVDKDSVKNAIYLLQNTKVAAIGDPSTYPGNRTDEEVVDDIRKILNEEFGTEANPYPYGQTEEDNYKLLSDYKTSIADIAVARKYLTELVKTLNKPLITQDPDGSGDSPARQYGYSNSDVNYPPSYWKGEIATDETMYLDSSAFPGLMLQCIIKDEGLLYCPYANMGATQSLDYFKWATQKALSIDDTYENEGSDYIEDQYRKYFIFSQRESSNWTGDGRAYISYKIDTESNTIQEINIKIYGVVIPDGETPSQNIKFFASDEGFHCVRFSSIDGYKCQEENYLINPHFESITSDQNDDYLGPGVEFAIAPSDYPEYLYQKCGSNPITSACPLFIFMKKSDGTIDLLLKAKVPQIEEVKQEFSSRLFSIKNKNNSSNSKGFPVMGSEFDPAFIVPISTSGHSGFGFYPGTSRFSEIRNITPTLPERILVNAINRVPVVTQSILPMISCAGVLRDFVPPLENEITSDTDPYENSWRHYLLLAKEAAQEADSLGEQLISAGLEMDERAESFIERLEEICGDVGNLDVGIWADSSDENQQTLSKNIENCVYDEGKLIDYVGLGNKNLCVFTGDSGILCDCDENEECPECPMISDTCPQDGRTWEQVNNLLEIFNADGTKATANCKDIVWLREFFLKDIYYPPSPDNPIYKPSTNSWDDNERKNLVANLYLAGLFDSEFLGNLLTQLEIKHSWYGYYYGKVLGNPFFAMDKPGVDNGLCPLDTLTRQPINCADYNQRTSWGRYAIRSAIALSYLTSVLSKESEDNKNYIFIPKIKEGKLDATNYSEFYHPSYLNNSNIFF